MRKRRRASRPGIGVRGLVVGAALALAVSACTRKPVTAPTVPAGAPRYPDFIFPSAQSTNDVAVPHQAAWDTLQAGDARGAERQFAALLKRYPDFYPAEAGLGYAALARRDAAAAITHFDKALAANASYAPALAGKGDALLAQGHGEAALAAFQAAIAANRSLTILGPRIDALKFKNAQDVVAGARKAADAGRFDEARRAYESAIAASPDSAFLHRELALVERKAGDTAAAVAQAQEATRLDPADTRALTLLAEIYEGDRQWTKAADAYAAVNALDPSEALAAKIDQMRQEAALDAMPAEYKAIDGAQTVTRAQLAALLGVRLDDLLRRARGSNAVLTTDTRGSWAAPWIMAVTRAGVMEPFANHTFQPNATVRRGDLAGAASRVLTLIAAEKPRLAERWRDPRPRFTDLSPAHLSYPAAARSVSAGVMAPLEGQTFQLSRPVTGAEALDTVSKLEALAKK
jgi:tetratricopeptide (TPR) repeat protein